jgi:pimeloyl-ACP methyl ester carboxylesterase
VGGGGVIFKRASLIALAVLGGLALVPSPAGAVDKLVTLDSDGPGPEQFDKVYARQIGPPKADRVLVLMPGTIEGAGNFTLIARNIVKRVDDLQVWAIDRRSQALEDTAMFERALAGEISQQEMFDYYLGWIANGGIPADHYQFADTSALPFAREWGMETALEDARTVIRHAGHKGREVILGGHSLGASLTAAYGAWDFDGRPGYKDIEGMVLIDGGLLGSFDPFNLAQAQEAIAELEAGNPFVDLFDLGIPEAHGLFVDVGGAFAKLDPLGAAAILESFPLLPSAFNPSGSVTNRALLGHAFDRDTSPPDLAILHVNAGRVAESGDPRDWVNGGVTPIARLIKTFGQQPTNGSEWFFPRRLTIDTNGANELRQNEVADFLGLRLLHAKRIDVPIYAFQTDLTEGGVLRGAKRLIKRAKTKRSQAMLVDGAPQQSHLDPLVAKPSRNEFLRTVVEFLDGRR